MSRIHYDPTDSESTSFLQGESKVSALQEREESIAQHGLTHWNRLSSPMVLPRILVYLVILALGVILATLIAILVSLNGLRKGTTPPSAQTMITVPTNTVVFKPDESYNVDPFGPDGLDNPWQNLAPPGKGHIRVENPGAWGLSGGFPLDDESGGEEYTVSVFHQLHCLAAITSKLSRLLDWYRDENDKEYLRFVLGQETMADYHIYHCIDYIRQSIMCNGDTTLEKAMTGEDGNIVRGVDGWGVGHECRSFDTIYAFAAGRRSRNITGID